MNISMPSSLKNIFSIFSALAKLFLICFLSMCFIDQLFYLKFSVFIEMQGSYLNGCSSVLFFVAQSCSTLCDPMDCSTPGFPVLHDLPEFSQTHAHGSVMPSNHLILCRPLLLLPSIFPSIRGFSNESALPIRCLKYWGFSLSPSNEYSGLIYYRTDWFLKKSNPKEYFVINPKEL